MEDKAFTQAERALSEQYWLLTEDVRLTALRKPQTHHVSHAALACRNTEPALSQQVFKTRADK